MPDTGSVPPAPWYVREHQYFCTKLDDMKLYHYIICSLHNVFLLRLGVRAQVAVVCLYTHTHTHTHGERERGRDGERERGGGGGRERDGHEQTEQRECRARRRCH